MSLFRKCSPQPLPPDAELFLSNFKLIPAAPAVTAMYAYGYQLTREVPKHERRGFFKSYRLNFVQSAATMGPCGPGSE